MRRFCRRRLAAGLALAGISATLAWIYWVFPVVPREIAEQSAATVRINDGHSGKTFVTTFARSERPLLEIGSWHHSGRTWALVRSVGHHAVGTQSGAGRYDDSYAYLDGFRPNQTAQATLWINSGVQGNYQEFELLLHWSDTPDSARGYECNLAWNGAYAQIVRWNGPIGDFTYIATQSHFPPGLMPPQTGDTLSARIEASTISIYLDKHDGNGDRLLVRGWDATFKDGNPGIGFYIEGQHDAAQFGFSRFAAWSD